jgi:tryptophan synthase alpha chain
MRKLDARLAALSGQSEGAFAPFLVLGDPDVASTSKWIDAIASTRPDLFEFGFPFSDPPADGPVIQAADARALAAGTTPDDCFGVLARAHESHGIPAALLVYANIVGNYGLERFYSRCAETGVDAVLVADVPLEEAQPYVDAARAAGVAPVFVASRLSSDERLDRIKALGEAYVYLVGHVGVTGERAELDDDLRQLIDRVRARTGLPVLVGFGISAPEQVRRVIEAGADGAISGSAIVRRIERHHLDEDLCTRELREFATTMKKATLPLGETPCSSS